MQFMTISSVPFKPSLLVIDSSIPNIIRKELIMHLEMLNFVICPSTQVDTRFLPDIQRLFDSKKHVIVFVNRGVHAVARATFSSLFHTTLTGLIPRPNLVVVDCLYTVTVDDWFSQYAPDRLSMLACDVQDSVGCSISIASTRKLMLLFRQYLNSSLGNDNIATNHLQRAISRISVGFTLDLESFLQSISNPRDIIKSTKLENEKSESIRQRADYVLAATIACALHLWEAPLSEWKKKDIIKGSTLFFETFHTNWEALTDGLDLQSQKWRALQKSGLLHWKRLKQTFNFEIEWVRLHELDLYTEPARWLLFQWIQQVMNIIERYLNYISLHSSSTHFFLKHISKRRYSN